MAEHFWGTGWSFPPTFDSGNKQLRMVVDEDCINQSIALILNTQLGERAMNPDFGSPLQQYLFKQLNANTLGQIKHSLSYALLHLEPRIKVEDIKLSLDTRDQPVLQVDVHYRILHTNSRHNMVYPYLLNEGTLLSHKQKGLTDYYEDMMQQAINRVSNDAVDDDLIDREQPE